MIPEELMKVVGQAAREARERLDMNQAEVARAAGISAVVYGRIERGMMLPAVPTLRKIATENPNPALLQVNTGTEAVARGETPYTLARLEIESVVVADSIRIEATPQVVMEHGEPSVQLCDDCLRIDFGDEYQRPHIGAAQWGRVPIPSTILQFIDCACGSALVKNALAYQCFVDTVDKYRTGR